jgi:hypothetical protein
MFLIMLSFSSIYLSFSIPSTTHSLTRFDIIHINPFFENSDNLSSQVPSTLDTFSHVRSVSTHYFAGTDTLLSGTPKAQLSSTAPKLCLRLWIHLYVHPYVFVSPQNYQVSLILVILHPLLLFNFCSLSL